MSDFPVVAITMGDPCGVGPEVVAKALLRSDVRNLCMPLVIGNASAMQHAASLVGTPFTIHAAQHAGDVSTSPDTVSIIDPSNLNYEDVIIGQVSAVAGKASMEWVELAARLSLGGGVEAIATAPLNKEAAAAAGYEQIGHMELLQSITQAKEVATMLMSKNLRVVHLTTHRSVRRACDAVTRENIVSKVRLTDEYFKRWGFDHPRIGVAALNPHSSDGGLLGDEEAMAIEPAVADAHNEGIDVTGPVPADIIFTQAINGKYDAVLCMYHDQGHIPVKVYGFEESVSINLGLPLIRTSVDHGTAFDIAGKGVADETSMVEAIKLAASLASGKGLPR
ncbi:MAG: 4-hydroxythreonine-4-phosphate dehydrogenase PdxA [Chloroflexota bacterium]|nr:4-hydroxythreonine-4-phosphate dehydrogenase PdxA [Chloroflexota bacterium]